MIAIAMIAENRLHPAPSRLNFQLGVLVVFVVIPGLALH
jgi:hypothetical protein